MVVLAVGALVAAALTVAASVGEQRGGWAIFDNASAVAKGGDVKIAGARVGVVESLDVAPGKKAALVLRIDDSRFTPFRRNALHDRPCHVHRREVGRMPAGHRAGRAAPHRRARHRTGPAPAARDSHQLAGRPGHRQRHPAALPATLDDRSTRSSGQALSGHGPELNRVIHRAEPRLPRDRQGPGHARQAEPDAREAGEGLG